MCPIRSVAFALAVLDVFTYLGRFGLPDRRMLFTLILYSQVYKRKLKPQRSLDQPQRSPAQPQRSLAQPQKGGGCILNAKSDLSIRCQTNSCWVHIKRRFQGNRAGGFSTRILCSPSTPTPLKRRNNLTTYGQLGQRASRARPTTVFKEQCAFNSPRENDYQQQFAGFHPPPIFSQKKRTSPNLLTSHDTLAVYTSHQKVQYRYFARTARHTRGCDNEVCPHDRGRLVVTRPPT